MIEHSMLVLASALGVADSCSYARDWSALTDTEGDRYADVISKLDLAIRNKDSGYVSRITFTPIRLLCRGS